MYSNRQLADIGPSALQLNLSIIKSDFIGYQIIGCFFFLKKINLIDKFLNYEKANCKKSRGANLGPGGITIIPRPRSTLDVLMKTSNHHVKYYL